MPMVCTVQALLLEGFSIADTGIQNALAAIERFSSKDAGGKRTQACVSPHWDTGLEAQALCDFSMTGSPDPRLARLNGLDRITPIDRTGG